MGAQVKQKVTAVFDVGKTNKKFFLFDTKYRTVYKEYTSIREIVDEDGFPTEDIFALQDWIKSVFNKIVLSDLFDIKSVNFSTYGASFIHLDENGEILTPLYNYLKPIPSKIIDEFKKNYGDVSAETGTPESGMLNSGMQLYWLKKCQPEVFKKIKYSLHFPQYISYLFTGIPLSEYTSLGCHTGLWDYNKQDYHSWVYKEDINMKLPPIVSAQTSLNTVYQEKKIRIGVGIHDSSAALLPFIYSEKQPFLLVSTGTWSISLNPFNTEKLSKKDIQNNCLNYMKVDGGRVKATRFFMGNEYSLQVKKLSAFFNQNLGFHKTINFDSKLYLKLKNDRHFKFSFEQISVGENTVEITDLAQFKSYNEAYHQLMIDLMRIQEITIKNAIGDTKINKIYIDGGFTDNDIFIKLMGHCFQNYKVRTTKSPLGSAIGAAMVISKKESNKKFLKKRYVMRKLSSLKILNES
ncbi:FGGY family carbohydrate kinase [Algibacter sp. AS12]|uniref:FGGY-family carbohydrate kinase n=1 Tax=Algibacter sp. AS12 TaxID=3135773 RepID=UPI00398AB6FD